MPVEEDAPATSGDPAARPRSGRRRRWLIALAVVAVLFLGATARLFIWPGTGMPSRVGALVSLDTPGGTLGRALRLAAQHRAPDLVISLGTPRSGYGCPRPVPGVRLICFNPDPGTTRGEAEYVGRLAHRYHWRSVAIITITPQATRARLRMERCFRGPVYVLGTPIPLASWPYQLGYEWGALAKALIWQRAC
ncbi:MAG TPA: hypothetical protein VGD68_03375 [Streptosporangiaceae bacterium]